MTPLSPRLLKGGLVQMDPGSGRVLRVIGLQYNPDTLSRTLQVQTTGESGDRWEAMRLKGAAVETIKVEIEIEGTERLGDPQANPVTVKLGIQPELAALEALVQPRADDLQANDALAGAGVLEVLPLEQPLTLFVWSRQRVVPVRVTDLSITEEAFDVALNPIRAKVSLGLRVLSVDDLGFKHRGGTLFMAYLRNKESLAGQATPVQLSDLGVEGLGLMPDPLQELLAAGAVPTTTFPPTSRYADVGVDAFDPGGGQPAVPFLRRRFCPRAERFALLYEVRVTEGDRRDVLGARHVGDAELWWRLADANGVVDPRDLTDPIGRRLRITLPEGVPGA